MATNIQQSNDQPTTLSGRIGRTGHITLLGMDGGTNAIDLPSQICSLAVNRVFRNRNHVTRPAFLFSDIDFNGDDAAKSMFENHAIRGVFEYAAQSPNAVSCLIVFVGTRIMALYCAGTKTSAITLWDGLSQLTDVAAYVQIADRAYFQDGEGLKLGWDGVNDVYVLGSGNDDMPIFIGMVECQGRIVGFTESSDAIISDHVYSNGVGTTTGAESWTEYQYIDDIGAITMPAMLGRYVGAIAIRQDNTFNAEGPVLVMGTKGFYTLNLSGPRAGWNVATIQRPYPVIGGGCSRDTLVSAGTDVMWQSSDGSLRSFRTAESQAETDWGEQPISNEVKQFTNQSFQPALSSSSAVVFGERLLMTVAMRTVPDVDGHQHRYGLGMVAMDFDRGTMTNPDQGFSWDGLWTGINPVKLCVVGGLCYAVAFNGKNQLFQIEALPGGDDRACDGSYKKIESFYVTPWMFWDKDVFQPIYIKRLLSASVTAVLGRDASMVCGAIGYSGRQQRSITAVTQGSPEKPIPVVTNNNSIAGTLHFGFRQETPMESAFQIYVGMTGMVKVDMLNIRATLQEQQVTQTSQLTERFCKSEEQLIEPFGYKICP